MKLVKSAFIILVVLMCSVLLARWMITTSNTPLLLIPQDVWLSFADAVGANCCESMADLEFAASLIISLLLVSCITFAGFKISRKLL